jgi:hypothetical protein
VRCPSCNSGTFIYGWDDEGNKQYFSCFTCDWKVSLEEVADALELKRRVEELPERYSLEHSKIWSPDNTWFVIMHNFGNFELPSRQRMSMGNSPLEALKAWKEGAK